MARPEPVCPGPCDEVEQGIEPEGAVAARARVRRLTRAVGRHERRDHRLAELLPKVERHVREPEGMARRARGGHRRGRAARALRTRAVRVLPEPQRHADRVRTRSEKRDRAVHSATHRDRDPSRPRLGGEDLAERGCERLHGKRVAADGRGFEQRQSVERTLEAVRTRAHDTIAVHDEMGRSPLTVLCRVSD